MQHDPSQMFLKQLLKIRQCVLMTQTKLALVHGGAAPQFLSKWMYQWISQGYSDVRSTVQLADVLPGTEIYTQLHRINDSRDMIDSQLGLDDKIMCGFLEVAGCTSRSESRHTRIGSYMLVSNSTSLTEFVHVWSGTW